MSNKKNLTKAKKIRKQLLAASATGLLLVSSTANTGTSLIYAAEKQQPTTTEKNTKNLETASSSSQVASDKSVNPSVANNQVETNLLKENQRAGTQVQNLQSDLNDLYSRYSGGFDNTGLSSEATQSAFAALQQRINDLPNSSQKQALQGQLNSMQAMLQEVQLKTASGQVIAQVDTNPKGTYVRTFAGNVSGNATIGKIQITQPKYNTFMYLFNKEYKGGTYQNAVSGLIGTTKGRGDKLIITTNEMPLAVNSNIHLSNTVSKEYTFKLNSNGKWELSSSSYDAVQNAVNALFNGETPKPENTQEQIDQAKNQVNNLFDGTDKNALLAKITRVQQAHHEKVQAATEAVNALFNGETPKPENTQEQFNEALNKVNALSKEEAKLLKDKLTVAFLALSTYKQEIHTTNLPSNNANAEIRMGQGHDRQDLGLQIQQGATITIKQTNPKFTGNLTLRLLTNDSHTESAINFSKSNVSLTAQSLAVPFVETPYNQENGEKPTIEFSVNGQKILLPKFNKQTAMADFQNAWNATNGYALIQGKRFQIFLPERNKTQTLGKDLNQLINLYDNEIIGYYNELIGLSDNDPNPLNRASERRYFYKADAHGVGALYYGGAWAAQNSPSGDAWLSDGWGTLHETGHGYQGSFMNKGMEVGEVWNNLYGVIYNYKHMGKEAADRNSWLYDYGRKQTIENSLKTSITGNNPQFNSQDVRKKLVILSNIIDKAGIEGLQNFYINYRKFANAPGFNANNYPLPDLITAEMGAPKKVDFSAILNAWGLTVSDQAKQTAKENNYQTVAHLAQVVPDDQLNAAIQRLTTNNRLSSVLSLVTNEELKPLNLTSNVTLNFKDGDLFTGMKLRIFDGKKLYKEITLGATPVTLDNMPNGVYSLELETNTGYIQKPYLFVKNSGTITISLNNYLKEATEAVNRLFQENDPTKIKTNLMQKDLDQVKQKVTALPDSSQKQALLTKLDQAFNQLQEFTFRGLGNSHFASFDVINGVATVRTNAGQPHCYFNDRYASITIERNNQTVYQKEYIGDHNYATATDTINLREGDLVTVTHREPNDIRLAINHANLKNNTSGTYRYDVRNGQLILKQ